MTLENNRCNYGFSDGCVSADLNWDNVSLSDISADGELLDRRVIRFDLTGKTAGQITEIIGDVCRQVREWCVEKKKPLVMEGLDTTASKAGSRYKGKTAKRHMSMFAYGKMTACIKNQGYRHSFEVYFTDPAYTSQAGKVLFMRKMGATVHEAASYCIGLKGMGLYKLLLPDWFTLLGPPAGKKGLFHAAWGSAMAAFQNVRVHAFYRDIRPLFEKCARDLEKGLGSYWDVAAMLKRLDQPEPVT